MSVAKRRTRTQLNESEREMQKPETACMTLQQEIDMLKSLGILHTTAKIQYSNTENK